MALDEQFLRENVKAKIAAACRNGIWEGTEVDFKLTLDGTPKALGRLLKHVLAFANTPRRREAYIIYGVDEKVSSELAHVGVSNFPTKPQIESIISEYTDRLEGIIVDFHFVLDGKVTPYLVIPFQFDGPYQLKKPFHKAPAAVKQGEIYMRVGSQSVPTGEYVKNKMRDWGTWFFDGRYVSSETDAQGWLRKAFSKADLTSETKEGYVRFVLKEEIPDDFGFSTRRVLGHAEVALQPAGSNQVERLAMDTAHDIHQRWLIAYEADGSAKSLAQERNIRLITWDQLFSTRDVYARYCKKYLDWWEDQKRKDEISTVVDLDFKAHGDSERQHSILSWLETSVNETERMPILLYGEFGTGKTITLRQLLASLCSDYLRLRSDLKAVYVNLNCIDIRATTRLYVETALFDLGLPRQDIDELTRMTIQGDIRLIFDGVDEMARPFSSSGREEVVEFLRKNSNSKPCVLSVRPNYFESEDEMHRLMSQLGAYDPSERCRLYKAAELRELTLVQVEELLSAGLSADDELENPRLLAQKLMDSGFGSFLKDPLVLSLAVKLLRTGQREYDIGTHCGKVSLVTALLDRISKRELEKRYGLNDPPLTPELFHQVLSQLGYRMVKDGGRSFQIDTVQRFVEAELSTQGGRAPRVPDTREMAEQFRTQTWLRAEGSGYAPRHEIFIYALAARHIIDCLHTGQVSQIEDWNAEAPAADTVIGYTRELLGPRDVVLAASYLSSSSLTVNSRQLILSCLKGWNRTFDVWDLSKCSQCSQAHDLPVRLGEAVRAAVAEPDTATALISSLSPMARRSAFVLSSTLSYLFLSSQSSHLAETKFLAPSTRVIEELYDFRAKSGARIQFTDVLDDLREKGINESFLRAAGLNRGRLLDPLEYYPVFSELLERLQPNAPNPGTWNYVKSTADYLRGRKASAPKSRRQGR